MCHENPGLKGIFVYSPPPATQTAAFKAKRSYRDNNVQVNGRYNDKNGNVGVNVESRFFDEKLVAGLVDRKCNLKRRKGTTVSIPIPSLI